MDKGVVARCGNCMWRKQEPSRGHLCVETGHHYIWDRRSPNYPSHKVVNPGWFGCGFHRWGEYEDLRRLKR